ncbi:4'-phosphopantetheinyl transferase superfamily protein [Solirubrobacter sp. CPCC 204708]|uniref:4'-phosphopantetheinyl transferase superfamily protein n=1 Tax=Solirubrobacter deserti TaxID=2282478 RepID=A0ABT4RDF0_9ACTN|nr:4'-phosphopantetheinyl transferase superfamily protein [Solirubrobacter deserti]MBE2314559.1 4'-phosphopantetheinyl transferase superfamily protein [Solirubrobacter deserti]MDA0136563.1 4'-phosphopantetheinyl transferase superfamily protein [Solirubrobacter deserti]
MVGLGQDEPLVARLRGLLSADERARADRLIRPEQGARWTVSRAALRILLCARLGCTPEEIHFHTAEHGKPCVPGTPLRFNLSHSGELALIALSEDLEVGVDVERPGRNVAAIERTLSPGEHASGHGHLQIWCRKEAWAKAIGGGLGWAPERFDTTAVEGYTLTDLELSGGYVGALAVEGEDAAHTLCRLTF